MLSDTIFGLSEPVSSLTHFGGAILLAFAGWRLLHRAGGDRVRFICVAIFVASALFLLTMSGLFHMAEHGTPTRALFRMLDFIGIFLLIAGTYTPTIGILFQGRRRVVLMSWIWGATLTGIVLRLFFLESVPPIVNASIYLGLGWSGVLPAILITRRFGLDFALPLWLGAIAYSMGGIMEACGVPVLIPGVFGPHEQFHCLVLIGLGLHASFIQSFAEGAPLPWEDQRKLAAAVRRQRWSKSEWLSDTPASSRG